MARGVNKVILVGTLGKDPEVKYTANSNAIANLSVATSESWKDKNTGEKQEKTEWHRVVIFGKLAEIAGQYLTKGSQVYLEGKLQTRKWQDQNTGQDRYSTEVVIDGFSGTMQMLGGRNGGDTQFGGQPQAGNGFQNNNAPNFNAPQQSQQNYGNNAPQQGQGFGQGFAQPNNGGYAPQNQNMQPAPASAPFAAHNDFDDDDVPF